MKNIQPILLPAGGGSKIKVGGASLFVKLFSNACGGVMTITEYRLPPNFPGPPPHKHRQFEHAWYVLRGEVNVQLGAEMKVLQPGSFLFIPKYTVHAFSNLCDHEAGLLAIDTPGGFEKYYGDLQDAIGDNKTVDQQIIRDIQLKYDTYPPDYVFESEQQ
ncbi:MAG: cupin domain-containing protein [Bacteroidota bacterium]